MITLASDTPERALFLVQGWAASLVLHAIVVGVVALFVTSLRPPSQSESFRWEVAVVQSPDGNTSTTSASVTPSTSGRESVPESSFVSKAPARDPAETRPPAAKQSNVAPPSQVRMEPQTSPATSPSRKAPAESTAGGQGTIDSPRPVPHAPPPSPPSATTTTPVPAKPTSQPETIAFPPPADENPPFSIPSPSTPEFRAGTPGTDEAVALERIHRDRSANNEPASAIGGAAGSDTDPSLAGPSSVESEVSSPQIAGLPTFQSSTPGLGHYSSPQKQDYTWLAQDLLTRISAMIRYPVEARLNQWQGKVVVKLVVNAEGEIENPTIVQSSGHPILDEEALALLRHLSPMKLDRPLGADRIPLQVPIRYSLK